MSDIVTLANYKHFLKIDISVSTYDDMLTLRKAEVEATVLERLKRDLFTQEYVEYLDGNGTNHLMPEQFPITAISKLEVYDGLDGNNDEVWTEWTVGSYYQRLLIVKDVEVFMDGALFPKGTQNIRLTYTAGYTADTMPKEIQKICLELMKLYWDSSDYGENRLGIQSNSRSSQGGTENITYDTNLEEKILKRLDSYGDVRCQ